MGGCHTISVPMTADAASIQMLIQGIRQLGIAMRELKEFQLEGAQQKARAAEFSFVAQNGVEIAVTKNEAKGELEFVMNGTELEKEKALETVNKVKQVYSRIKVMNDLKKKGYRNVKEEKLADGSIRLVLQKWQ